MRRRLCKACQVWVPPSVVTQTLFSCACMTVTSLSMVTTVLPFGSRALLVILTHSPSVNMFTAVTDSADFSESSAGDRYVGGIQSLSVSSLSLTSLRSRRIETSYIFSSCKLSIRISTDTSFIWFLKNSLLKIMLIKMLYVVILSNPQFDRMFV